MHKDVSITLHGELVQVRELAGGGWLPARVQWGREIKLLMGAEYNARMGLVYLRFEGGLEISAPPAGYVCLVDDGAAEV